MSPLIFVSIFLFCFFSVFTIPSSSQQLRSFNSSNSPWQPAQNTTLVSKSTFFAAGFLPVSTARPIRYYFSVWFNIPQKTVVWTANPYSPVDANSSLSIGGNGDLRLIDSSGRNLWPDPPSSSSNSTVLLLNDQGNLVFGSWNSFENPTDTILPNQSIANLSSRNGNFSFKNRRDLVYDSNNYTFWSASNLFRALGADGIVTQDNGAQVVSADFGNGTLLRRLTLDDDGNLRMYSCDPADCTWTVVWQALQEICKIGGTCGRNAICINDGTNSNVSCVCPPGFGAPDLDKACQPKIEMNLARTKFIRLDYVNFSGGSNMTDLKVLNYSTCASKCLTDRTCLGFQFKYDGTGFCVLLDNLLYGYWSPGSEAAFFLRVDSSENATSTFIGMTELLETTCPVRISLPDPPKESDATTRNIVIICTLFAAELISGVVFFWRFLKKYIKYRDMARTFGLEFLPAGGPKRFSFAELKAATNDFSNLIGKGGFGDVYKGELSDHRVVAVKCLKNVAGGDAEFWAEVTIIARMHHLNLVRLWGFCAEKGQRILVYEYVPNGSLDKYLFRSKRNVLSNEDADDSSPILDWNIRYRIALGVARAIAYLHEECLEWVLHCDIKPENILVGDDFCPKISDFGLAKLRKKEVMVSMSRIRGTRGYLAPEWVKMDPITPKADVYSFGMVLLEIVTGVRNFEIQGSAIESEAWYFPEWAFDKAFKEMKVEDILDRQIKHCYDSRLHFDMVDRMVKTAMWCLQDRAEMRPSMGKVAKMLEGTVEITEPKKPTIFFLSED